MRVWRLTVPYEDRVEAKKKGCRWNWVEKYWYLEGSWETYQRLPDFWRQAVPEEIVQTAEVERSETDELRRRGVNSSPLDELQWEWNGRYWYKQTENWTL